MESLSVGDLVEVYERFDNRRTIWTGRVVRETKTLWIVAHRHATDGSTTKFSKSDLGERPQYVTPRWLRKAVSQ